jgi:hypothetical protein
MDDYTDDAMAAPVEYGGMSGMATDPAGREPDEAEKKLVGKLTKRILADRSHHKKAFERMREDMEIARRGAPKGWPESSYVANITGRHINQKTAALYAKNPKAVARRRERLDFRIWDEDNQSLMMALQTAMTAPPPAMQVDPMSGMAMPIVDPLVQQAQALIQDYQQGMMRRQQVEKIGKTLELLYDYFMKEQTPVDFKTSMKQLVRRAGTCCVGYLKLGFQREFDKDPTVTERLADFQQQLLYIQQLEKDSQEGDPEKRMVKQRELELAVKSLQEQEYVLIREGLVFDFPDSTRVIPDKMTRNLTGFVGARWLTVEYLYTHEEVERIFGVNLKAGCATYSDDGSIRTDPEQSTMKFGDDDEDDGMVCVWEHYDRQAGLVYILADGHHGFLKEPGAPDIYVEDFWPVFALTFNEVENPKHLFPPSDVRLMLDMQNEYNRSRQGKREHRIAARPRFAILAGALDDDGKIKLRDAGPFEAVELNLSAVDNDISKAIQSIQIPGVDPNLYDTNEIMSDIQYVVGSQEATFGSTAGATATESGIAESSRVASVDSSVDDLDAFLTRVARAAGQVLLREMSQEQVIKIAGEGALWPQMTLEDIATELYLEIEAGSSGKPNQVQEIRNWKEMLPFLIQMPGIDPVELVRESLRRLDDKLDLTRLIKPDAMAIVAMNRMSGATPAPGAMPEDQGGAGADNTSVPGGPTGSVAPGGNNQQAIM